MHTELNLITDLVNESHIETFYHQTVLDNIVDFIRASTHVYCIADRLQTPLYHQSYVNQFGVENSNSTFFSSHSTLPS